MKGTIPKVIHYCWFGGNELPELALKCIESWKKYCPEYEIKEWNESNFDINCCDYVREAYEAKRWAFVSDYARFKILYEHGGIYFDTDVELIRSIEDIVVKNGFMGIENEDYEVNPGLGVGMPPKHALIFELLTGYHDRHFLDENGNCDLKTVVKYTTEILKKYGLSKKKEIQQCEGVYIYPKEYFCPLDYETGKLNTTENTRTIHHYKASWHSEMEAYAMKLRRKMNRLLPRKVASVMAFGIAKIKFDGWKAFFLYVIRKIRR